MTSRCSALLFSGYMALTACLLTGCGQSRNAGECPPEGRAKPGSTRKLTAREKALNEGKNRSVTDNPSMPPVELDLTRILHAPTHWEKEDFTEGTYVSATCYVVKYTEEGPESCNCYEAEKDAHDGDVHIFIADNPEASKDECMVAEITPAFKTLHPDYARMLQAGEKVTISGYLLYDYMHERNSKNSCTNCDNQVWRKTCWEIHPVLSVR